MSNKKLVVYATGGTSAKVMTPGLVQAVEQLGGQVVFLDTSTDQKMVETSNGNYYHVKDDNNEPLEGAGANRPVIAPHVARAIPDIIAKHPPGEFNITIGSGGGGSGSTLAPLLAKYMSDNSISVINLFSTSEEAQQQLENSLKVIETYQAIGQSSECNVPVMHWHSANPLEFQSINNSMRVSTIILAILILRSSFDRADIRSFLTPPGSDDTGITMLSTHLGQRENEQVIYKGEIPEYALTRMSLYDPQVEVTNPNVRWAKLAEMPESGDLEKLLKTRPAVIEYFTQEDAISKAYEMLSELLRQKRSQEQSRGKGLGAISAGTVDNTGLVL